MKTLLVDSLHQALLLPAHAAPSAAWDSDKMANAGKGVYDPAKWAVAFKYSNVTGPAGAHPHLQHLLQCSVVVQLLLWQ